MNVKPGQLVEDMLPKSQVFYREGGNPFMYVNPNESGANAGKDLLQAIMEMRR
jgi:hypothetical protein